MNSKKLIAILLLFSGLPIQAQQLKVSQTVIDCGKTGYMVPSTATFELSNKGKRPIVIDDVKADCGCTTVEIPKKKLAAGEKCTLRLTYDARQLGHYEKHAVITSHELMQGDISPVHITLKGIVLTEVVDYSKTYPFAMGQLLSDKNELEFDDVNRGDQPQLIIHVMNNSTSPMMPNIQHLPSYLKAVSIPEQLMPGRVGKVVLTLNSDQIHAFGLTQSTVYLASHLGDKVSPENELPVSVVLLPDLSCFGGTGRQYAPKMVLSSSAIELGNVKGKKVRKAAITITNQGRTTLNISSLQMFTAGLTLTLDKSKLEPNEEVRLKVVGNLGMLSKVRSKPRILMITNDPSQPKVVIPINIKK